MIFTKKIRIPEELKDKTMEEVGFCEVCWTAFPIEELEDFGLNKRVCRECLERLKEPNEV